MKTTFGTSGILCALLVVLALALVPADGTAGTPPNDNGDRLMTRDQDQLHECALDVPDLDRLQIRDRDQDRDRLHLLTLAPPLEENDGNVYRHRIQERAQHNWYLIPGLAYLVWFGTF